MKSIHALLVVLVFSNTIFAQEDISSKKIHKNFSPINETLFVSKYETTNADYRFYLSELKSKKSNETYQAAMYDSSVWDNGTAYMEPMTQLYFSHPAYDNYPIVGVSKDKAQAYCKWLTEYHNTHPKKKYEKVLFRLPTQKEWTVAAKGNVVNAPYPWNGQETRNAKGCHLANFKPASQEKENYFDFIADGSFLTAPVNSYFPNDYECFNISGNVAEMVSDVDHSAFGGSWNTTEDYLVVAPEPKATPYEDQSWDVGFRVFMEIIEE